MDQTEWTTFLTVGGPVDRGNFGQSHGRHSLVTPIDWKPYETNIKPDTIILKSPLAGDAY